jgi:hypothetical protein
MARIDSGPFFFAPPRPRVDTTHTPIFIELLEYGFTREILLTDDDLLFSLDSWEALLELVKNRHFTVTAALAEVDGLTSTQAHGITRGLTRHDVIHLSNPWHITALHSLRSHGLETNMLLTRHENGHRFHWAHFTALLNLVEDSYFTIHDALTAIDGISDHEARAMHTNRTATCTDVMNLTPACVMM